MGSLSKKIITPFKDMGQDAGLFADTSVGSSEMRAAVELQKKAMERLAAIGVPEVEAQQIALTNPELVLSSDEEKLRKTFMEDVVVDPRLEATKQEVLQRTEELSRTGVSPEDRAALEGIRDQLGADEQARQASILQNMAMRGSLGSGSELASKLASSQATAQRSQEAGRDLAAQASQSRRAALASLGQLSGQMSAEDFARQSKVAQARDVVSQFNAGVAARDTGAKRQQAQTIADLKNRQEMYNKQLIQQKFENELRKATGQMGATQNVAQSMQSLGATRAKAEQQNAAAMRDTGMALMGAAQDAGKTGATGGAA